MVIVRSSECEIRIVVSAVVLTLLSRFHLSVFTSLVESPEHDREFLSPFGRTIGFAVRSSVRGPRKFAICGESGGCCRSNDGVILCDLHTERDAQFVGVVVIKK